MSFPDIFFILRKVFPTIQIHQNGVNEGLHHVVIEIQPFCVELFKHSIQFLMIGEVIFERAEHDFQI